MGTISAAGDWRPSSMAAPTVLYLDIDNMTESQYRRLIDEWKAGGWQKWPLNDQRELTPPEKPTRVRSAYQKRERKFSLDDEV